MSENTNNIRIREKFSTWLPVRNVWGNQEVMLSHKTSMPMPKCIYKTIWKVGTSYCSIVRNQATNDEFWRAVWGSESIKGTAWDCRNGEYTAQQDGMEWASVQHEDTEMQQPVCMQVFTQVNLVSVPSKCQSRADICSQWSIKATQLILHKYLYFAVKLVGVEEMERQMMDEC